jgi:hypothetical protein
MLFGDSDFDDYIGFDTEVTTSVSNIVDVVERVKRTRQIIT